MYATSRFCSTFVMQLNFVLQNLPSPQRRTICFLNEFKTAQLKFDLTRQKENFQIFVANLTKIVSKLVYRTQNLLLTCIHGYRGVRVVHQDRILGSFRVKCGSSKTFSCLLSRRQTCVLHPNSRCCCWNGICLSHHKG